MQILAFGHRKYTGKDTAAKFIAADLRIRCKNLNIVRRNFADKLKDVAYEIYGWAGLKPREYYDKYPEDKKYVLPKLNKNVRQIWIEVGMKFREIYEDTWIDHVLE